MAEQKVSDHINLDVLFANFGGFEADHYRGTIEGEFSRVLIAYRDARTQAASDADEIARLKGQRDHFETEMLATSALLGQCQERAQRAEARLAEMATVTEAVMLVAEDEIAAMTGRRFSTHRVRTFVQNILETAAKSAAPDHPADAKAPGADFRQKAIREHTGQYDAWVAARPAPQSDDQACGAEGNADELAEWIFQRYVKANPLEAVPFVEMRDRLRSALASRPSSPDAVRVLVEALRQATVQAFNGNPASAIEVMDAALSDPRVTAALSGDPWC